MFMFLNNIFTAIFIFLWSSFLAKTKSMNLALGMPFGCEESDVEAPYLQCYDLHILGIHADVSNYHFLTIVTKVQ